ncbi:hypothetical protein LTR17_011970 [Elasticomyces elasticus]|nr:hypothetical protein LTR17_011970 [Elasticomyces elasticus]
MPSFQIILPTWKEYLEALPYPHINSWEAAGYYALSSAIIIGLAFVTESHFIATILKWPSGQFLKAGPPRKSTRALAVWTAMGMFNACCWNEFTRTCSNCEVWYVACMAVYLILIIAGIFLAGSAIARYWAPDQETLDDVVERGEMVHAEKEGCASSRLERECWDEEQPLLGKKASVNYGTEQEWTTDVGLVLNE